MTPLVQHREVSLPPCADADVTAIFASLFGFLGLWLATSLTACNLVLVKMLYVQDVLGDPTDNQNAGAGNK